ncbi:MAG: hypothetical protein QM705_02610 [Ancrocorticia sp.]
MMIRSRVDNSPVIRFFTNTMAVLLSVILGIGVSPAMAAQAPVVATTQDAAPLATQDAAPATTEATPPASGATSAPPDATPEDSTGTSPLIALAREVLAQLEKVLAPPSTPDYSSPAALAISLSFPLYGPGEKHGKKTHPGAYTDGGDNDQQLVRSSYKQARAHAIEMTANVWNSSPAFEESSWANCSAFTATVINNTVDPTFPSNLVRNQYAYMSKPENGWIRVGPAADYRPEMYKPGDIFITTGGGLAALPEEEGGHTFMWIGDYGGLSEVIAESAYGSKGSSSAKLPALRVNALKDGVDGRGRDYDVWRFVGKPVGYENGPDYSSAKNLAIDLAFPLEKKGKKAPYVSYTGGGRRELGQTSPWYYMARQRASELGAAAGAENLAPLDGQFAAASGFVSTVVQNTIDARFPGLMIKKQRDYLADPDNGWIKVGSTEKYKPASYQPGDVLITRDSNSAVMMWIGEHSGFTNVIADAAHGKRNSKTARLPGLRVSNLSKSGDPSGRHYDVYRYVGGNE